uniref:Uncharacterized protein n=1 Tax=Sphaerodactylus townsendi TaxID=933632 RepID=A0ACB8EV59_9SAUR
MSMGSEASSETISPLPFLDASAKDPIPLSQPLQRTVKPRAVQHPSCLKSLKVAKFVVFIIHKQHKISRVENKGWDGGGKEERLGRSKASGRKRKLSASHILVWEKNKPVQSFSEEGCETVNGSLWSTF